MATEKTQASFGSGRPNETTLGEAHALALLHGTAIDAPDVHQMIAACVPESGFKVLAYPCTYGEYYGKAYPKRRWKAGAAGDLDQKLHDTSSIANQRGTKPALELLSRKVPTARPEAISQRCHLGSRRESRRAPTESRCNVRKLFSVHQTGVEQATGARELARGGAENRAAPCLTVGVSAWEPEPHLTRRLQASAGRLPP